MTPSPASPTTPIAPTERLPWLDRFVGTGKHHVRYLDGIRAFAVLAVLIRHAWGLSGSPAIVIGVDFTPFVVMLSSGIDLFFVLSGFLLAQSFIRADMLGRPRPNIRNYVTARVLRIAPPYLVVLCVVVLFMTPAFIPEDRVFSFIGVVIFGAHVLFLQAAYLPAFGAYVVESPFWTLTVEMLFYLFLPILVLMFLKLRWRLGLLVCLAVSLTWLYLARYRMGDVVGFINNDINVFPAFDVNVVRFFLSHQFPAFLFDFGVGMLVANVIVRRQTGWRPTKTFAALTSPRAGVAWFAVGLAWTLVTMWVLGRISLNNGFAYPINYMDSAGTADLVYYFLESIPMAIGFAMLIMGVCLSPGRLQMFFSWQWLAFVGVIGYSVYLLHMPILHIVNEYSWVAESSSAGAHFIKLFFFAAPLIILVSTAFFIAIERPALRWSRAASIRGRNPSPLPVDTVSTGSLQTETQPQPETVSPSR